MQFPPNSCNKKILITTLLLTAVIIYALYSQINIGQSTKVENAGRAFFSSNRVYSIDTLTCKIPRPDPNSPETKNLLRKEEYSSCNNDLPLLTYLSKENGIVTLNVNQSVKHLYAYFSIYCCYATVQRQTTESEPDDGVSISDCISFTDNVKITSSIVYVSCSTFFSNVYRNVHAVISPKLVKSDKSKKTHLNQNSTFSVLLVAIDSISVANFERTMPKTRNFVENHKDFVSLKGYTKIGLNTLPNLMGILGGVHLKSKELNCAYVEHIDDCYLVWKDFSLKGYITAYGEDSPHIGSFNCCGKKGFHTPPTEFYFRPYMQGAKKIGTSERRNMDYCAGPETEAERIMNLAKDFTITFITEPTFGLFWMNSFSHDDASMPAAMDNKVKEFFEETVKYLDETILFFFSDHGIRFGEIRATYTGWLEERLPFFYVYLPEKFKTLYPEKSNNVLINSKRLTNAYDIHMTLQEILQLADDSYTIKQSRSCPLCHSLFKEASETRTCKSVSISEQWCVCNVSAYTSLEGLLRKTAADMLIKKVNFDVSDYTQCAQYKLQEILYVGISQFRTILARVETFPKAVFEGSFTIIPNNNGSNSLKLLNDVERVDRYASHSWCMESSLVKKYCYCKEERAICRFFQNAC